MTFSQFWSWSASPLPFIFFIPLPYGPQPISTCLNLPRNIPFKPVSVTVVKKYLVAIRAWHIAQGWPPPLSEEDHNHISWSLQGLENLQGNRKCPIHPPITISMLYALHASLSIDEPFDACIWAMALCAFWGMMCFSEVSVTSRSAFDMAKHLTRKDAHFDFDLDGKPYVHLDLPSSKMAKPGKIQSIFLIPQEGLCPLATLQNLTRWCLLGRMTPYFHGVITTDRSSPWSSQRPLAVSMQSLRPGAGALPLVTHFGSVGPHTTSLRKLVWKSFA